MKINNCIVISNNDYKEAFSMPLCAEIIEEKKKKATRRERICDDEALQKLFIVGSGEVSLNSQIIRLR